MLGQLQTVQRVCCRGIRWQKAAAPCLPAAFLFIMSAFCLITAHLQPGWRCVLPSTRGGTGGGRGNRLYKPLFGLQGEKKSSWKKGAFIIFEPITIMVSANPTIVQVFQNREASAARSKKRNHLVHLLETFLQSATSLGQESPRYSTMLTPFNT